MARIPTGLLAAIALYVTVRVAILGSAFHAVALPMYELYPMGTLAELARRGIDVPTAWFYDNAAGQILMGFLTVPVFATAGSTYLALKLLPALLGLGTLIVVWILVDRAFSRRAANVAALLVAVGPPTITKYSLINSGNHFENLFFTAVCVLCAYRWLASPWKTRGGLFAFGFSAGFALFVFLGALIPVGILLGLHVGVRGLRRTARDLPVLLAGFALGIAPLVAVNLATRARGAGFLEAKFAGDPAARGGDVLGRVVEFLGPELLRAPVFEPFAGTSRAFLSALFLAAFAAAYVWALPSVAASLRAFTAGLFAPAPATDAELARFERAKLVPFVLYLPLAALAYGLSNFRLGGHAAPVEVAGYRYYLPTILFALVLVAVAFDRLLARGGRARVAGLALITAAAVPSASSLAIPDWTFSNARVGARLDGYNLAQLARALVSTRNAVPHDEVVAFVSRLPDDVRPRVVTALGFNLGVQRAEETLRRGAPLDLDAHLGRWPADWRAGLALGLGHGLRFQARVRNAPIDAALDDARRVAGSDPALLAAVERGLAQPGVALPMPWESASILAQDEDLLARRGAEAPHFARGVLELSRALVARGIESDLVPARSAGLRAAAFVPD